MRFSRAPHLVETIRMLEKERNFNSYLVRGDYDIVSVSVESSHFLFKAMLDKRMEQLQLRETKVFTVDQFLKYHGCLVTPIRAEKGSSFYTSEILHYLFNLSKDWDSASESYKSKLLEMNLLMVHESGMPYEEEGNWRRTIIRLGFDGWISDAMHSSFQQYIKSEVIKSPMVRNCYSLKSPAPYLYIFEAVGNVHNIDDFIIHLHEDCQAGFPSVKPFTRCDDVMRKLSDGHWNVLLTIQTKPDLVALAEEKIIAPIFYSDQIGQTDVIHFIEKCEAVIRSIRGESLKKKCIEMLSEIQLALQLNSHSVLQDAVNSVAQRLVALMTDKLSGFYRCEASSEAVIAELKRRGMFREHTPTFGNLYPIFLEGCRTLTRPISGRDDGGEVFERFNEYRNSLILSKRTELLTLAEKEQAERVFSELVSVLPKYFEDVGDLD